MRLLKFITKGQAVIQGDSLRCAAARANDSKRTCNKLLVKTNEQGQIAGNFRCERCHQEIEVKLAPAREDLAKS
jgi:phage FluMu protein Com